MQSEFTKKVIAVVRSIPAGQVVSYGQAAAYVGVPRAARQVGGVLHTHDDLRLPWWRVINNQGRISIKNMFHTPDEQKRLLQQEGVQVSSEYSLDIEKYRFIASKVLLTSWQLDTDYQLYLTEKFPTL